MFKAYIDESGISSGDPHTIVSAVLVDAEKEDEVRGSVLAALEEITPPGAPATYFHATDIFHGRGPWEGIPPGERAARQMQFTSLARKLRLPISYGIVRRDSLPDIAEELRIRSEEHDHLSAFTYASIAIHRFLEKHLPPGSPCTLIVEDCPAMKNLLQYGMNAAHDLGPLAMKAEFFYGETDPLGNTIPPKEQIFRVDQIDKTVCFRGKTQDPILWLADACAFATRRWMTGDWQGNKLVEAMLGKAQSNVLYGQPVSLGTWWLR